VRYAIVRRPNDTLNVRVHQRGSTRYVAIGVSVPHYAWLKAGRIKADHPGAARVNDRLAEIRRQLDLDLPGEPSLERAVALTRRIVRGDSRELVAYFRAQAAAYAARGQRASAVRLKGAIDHLAAFVRRPIQARDLTPTLLEEWRTHLAARLAPNTVAKLLAAIRTLVNHARRDGLIDSRPFEFVPIRQTPANKLRLTDGELERVATVELTTEPERIARDAYMLSVYLAGVRFEDLINLAPANLRGTRIEYVMRKTGKQHSLPVGPQARAIIAAYEGQSPYLVPILNRGRKGSNRAHAANAQVNLLLKSVAAQARVPVDGFSFHTARHTFADKARRAGWPIYDISKALGHASIKVTERYLAGLDQDSLDGAMTDLWG